MIVKNEAKSIARTVASTRDVVDRYTILDTGSTDGTPDLIIQAFGTKPGSLHQEPFVDFSETRNRGLELERERATFMLLLNGDDELVNGHDLRVFCEEHADHPERYSNDHAAYNIKILYGPSSVFDSARLARSSAAWRYVGSTHEVLTGPGGAPAHRVPGAAIKQTPPPAHEKIGRWKADRLMLEADRKKDPTNTRTVFYLAQTYDCLDLHHLAYKTYQDRIEMGGWPLEIFECYLRQGRVAWRAAWPKEMVVDRLERASAHSPERAEPLYDLALYLDALGERQLALEHAKRAASLGFPKEDALFIDSEIYSWKANDLVRRLGG
jgi:tetratricopeptide (TPR) repeat protein